MKFDTGYPADSVEFCPARGFEDFFVCGTYKLLENTPSESSGSSNLASSRKRIGKCMLFKITEGDDGDELKVLQEIDMPAILDMKWSHSSNRLAVADSEGRISLLQLDTDEQLHEIQTVQCRPTETLCLSLDWSDRRNESEAGRIAVSCSDGTLSILTPDNTGTFCETESWHAHDHEPWITAWDYWDTNVLYSGGDDLRLKGWDVRQRGSSPTFVNKRFDAGVTSIQSHPHKEHILAVGSYASTVHIFDTRKPLVPITQADVGGGAWRIKWHPHESRSTDLSVACMHDGFKVVRFSPSVVSPDSTMKHEENEREWEIVKRFDEHESLAYGVDWSHRRVGKDEETVVASCSFYDHALHLWRV
ncbi:WD-40 repeat-containing protein [Fomitiporia mediterranea MF3/22]|uniref:WD-40 repeat-containing protein n=1 Tax=Fomitiporia mediterranea (strain MF3/22) TaxID=694068 RepID=UPI0004407889|nr:WD-40 repeat-containing protein [Fomitiporia mediterranea MF3/22]EJD03951.1 WD-40 repeat-containing protein [Fomitiporia mediterranea MF3/22]